MLGTCGATESFSPIAFLEKHENVNYIIESVTRLHLELDDNSKTILNDFLRSKIVESPQGHFKTELLPDNTINKTSCNMLRYFFQNEYSHPVKTFNLEKVYKLQKERAYKAAEGALRNAWSACPKGDENVHFVFA